MLPIHLEGRWSHKVFDIFTVPLFAFVTSFHFTWACFCPVVCLFTFYAVVVAALFGILKFIPYTRTVARSLVSILREWQCQCRHRYTVSGLGQLRPFSIDLSLFALFVMSTARCLWTAEFGDIGNSAVHLSGQGEQH